MRAKPILCFYNCRIQGKDLAIKINLSTPTHWHRFQSHLIGCSMVCDRDISWSYSLAFLSLFYAYLPGRVAQSVTCLATDGCLTADPGVVS